MRNKKILIPIVILIALIILAVVIFLVFGKMNKNQNKTISFNNQQANNETIENENNEEDIPEYYNEASEQFITGFLEIEEMQKFIDDYFDSVAYVAYDRLEGKDVSNLIDECNKISSDDEDVKNVEKTLLGVPTAFQLISQMQESLQQMQNQVDTSNIVTNTDDSNKIDNEQESNTTNTGNEITSIEDINFEIKEISNLQISEEDDKIATIDLIIESMGQEATLKLTFYEDIVIYITNEKGIPITDEEFSSTENDEENNSHIIDPDSTN